MTCTFPNGAALDCGAIPPGWARIAVSRLVEKHFCGPSPDCEEREVASDKEWGVLKTTAITWDGWNERAHKVLPRAYWGRYGLEVKSGDVLVTKAGPRDRVGVVVHVKSQPRHLIVSGKMIGLRLRRDRVLPQVLAGALTLRGPQEYIHARTTGMAESQVNFANEVLLTTEVCIPPLREQLRIAAVLNTVDHAIAETEAVIAKLKKVRAGLLYDLLTRGLDENGKLRDPVTHPEQFQDSPLGRIPKGWLVWKLREVLRFPPRNGYSPQEVPVFRGRHLLGLGCLTTEGFAPIQLKNAPLDDRLDPFLLHDGDLLISRSNTRDLVALPGLFRDVGYPCYYPDLMMRLVPTDQVLSEFLELSLRYSRSRMILSASATGTSGSMVKITGVGAMEIPIAFPPRSDSEEQQRILDSKYCIDNRLRTEVLGLGKLKSLKSGLMNDLLTGRVRVPEGLR